MRLYEYSKFANRRSYKHNSNWLLTFDLTPLILRSRSIRYEGYRLK